MLDLNNSDLLAVTVVLKDGARQRRFLVVDLMQIILIEPDSHRLGWGVARFSGFLQDLEVGVQYRKKYLANAAKIFDTPGERGQGRQPVSARDGAQAELWCAGLARAAAVRNLHLRRPHPVHGGQTEADQGADEGETAEDAPDS